MASADRVMYHTINSPIVEEVIGVLSKNMPPQIPIYASGGLAGVQSYLPPELHRKSSDLDYSAVYPINSKQEFSLFFTDAMNALVDENFSIKMNRTRATFDLTVSNEDNSILIQLPRRNRKNYFKNKETLRREYANAQTRVIGSEKYLVSDPADIVVRKLRRIEAFTKSQHTKGWNKQRFESLSNYKLEELLENVEQERQELISIATEADEAKIKKIYEVRMLADIFDIRALDEMIRLDKDILYTSINKLNPQKRDFANDISKVLIKNCRA